MVNAGLAFWRGVRVVHGCLLCTFTFASLVFADYVSDFLSHGPCNTVSRAAFCARTRRTGLNTVTYCTGLRYLGKR